MRNHLIATSNVGKLRDFVAAGVNSGAVVRALPGIEGIAIPEETADTFEGNARDKAVYYSRFAPGQIVVADDSGLEVDGLGGAPGVRSARFAADAGVEGSPLDEANNALLLRRLAGVPDADRGARYRCVLAAARDGLVMAVAEGDVSGRILEAGRGEGGFGYDPLFYLPEMGRTMAEISIEEKQGLSHRGRAWRRLLAELIVLEL